MVGDDLSFFEGEPSRQVLLFPLTSRVGKIRHTARMLIDKHGDDADLYWKQVASSNRKHLKRVGCSEPEIENEILSFFDAVQAEIIRMTLTGQSYGGTA